MQKICKCFEINDKQNESNKKFCKFFPDLQKFISSLMINRCFFLKHSKMLSLINTNNKQTYFMLLLFTQWWFIGMNESINKSCHNKICKHLILMTRKPGISYWLDLDSNPKNKSMITNLKEINSSFIFRSMKHRSIKNWPVFGCVCCVFLEWFVITRWSGESKENKIINVYVNFSFGISYCHDFFLWHSWSVCSRYT